MMELVLSSGLGRGDGFGAVARGGRNGHQRDGNSFIINFFFYLLVTHDVIKGVRSDLERRQCVGVLGAEHCR